MYAPLPNFRPITDWPAWRAQVQACRRCTGVLPTPRYGTGPRDRPVLAVVGQNPPQDPARGLHGGWMLHYDGPEYDRLRERSEWLLRSLVARLGLTTREVYVTQATKCPTAGNNTPQGRCQTVCRDQWLRPELLSVHPQMILALGLGAGHMTYETAVDLYGVTGATPCTLYDVEGVNSSVLVQQGFRQGGWLRFPHPQVVGRFLSEESWLDQIQRAFLECKLEQVGGEK